MRRLAAALECVARNMPAVVCSACLFIRGPGESTYSPPCNCRATTYFRTDWRQLRFAQATDSAWPGYDYRGLLNRDGSVLTAVTAAQLRDPATLYADLGCKVAAGQPRWPAVGRAR